MRIYFPVRDFSSCHLTILLMICLVPHRIEEEIQRLQKRQKELLEEWRNSCNTTLKWIADTSVRVQAQDIKTEDVDHARAQRQELEV